VLTDDADVPPLADIAAWWERHREATRGLAVSIDRAIAGGFVADRVGYAFASGYQAALGALLPALPAEHTAALCATEKGGAHPRAIETTLRDAGDGTVVLSGRKRWTTLASRVDELLVVATAGEDDAGRKQLRVVRVPARAAGVAITPMPAPPFALEIEHGEVVLDEVVVPRENVLEGDGYERYLKPFRTIEDGHVFAAGLAYVLRVARRHGWPRAFAEQLCGALVAVRSLALMDPRAPEVHVALAGVLQGARRLLEEGEAHWAGVDEASRARWARDKALFTVAEGARAQRAERAWELLAGR
jgi:hypothetical protein